MVGSLVQGSPPQVRGKHQHNRYQSQVTGITPAGAGKTDERADISTGYEDHPRRCGENKCGRK